MDAAVEPLVEAAKGLELGAPQIPYVSNVTGTWITESQVRDPQYWGRHMRGCVRFGDGVGSLLRSAERVWLELGPGSALSSLTRQQLKDRSAASTLPTMRQAQEQTSDVAVVIGALGRLWLGGSPIDWARFYADQRRYRIAVPTYPFERTHHWVQAERATRAMMLRLLPRRAQIEFSDWFHVPTWKRSRAARRRWRAPMTAKPGRASCSRTRADVGARMAGTLTGLGYRTVIVEAGAGFAKVERRPLHDRSGGARRLHGADARSERPGRGARCRRASLGAHAPRRAGCRRAARVRGPGLLQPDLSGAGDRRTGNLVADAHRRVHRRRARGDRTGDAACPRRRRSSGRAA